MGYDFAYVNDAPDKACGKCNGTGEYAWGAVVNGVPTHKGMCFSCKGTGVQSKRQIRTNRAYNYYKARSIHV